MATGADECVDNANLVRGRRKISSMSFAMQLWSPFEHSLSNTLRVVARERPKASALRVCEGALCRGEGVDHREQDIRRDVLVGDPVPVSSDAAQLVRPVHASNVDPRQSLVAGERHKILAREFLQTRSPQSRRSRQESRDFQSQVVFGNINLCVYCKVGERGHMRPGESL